MRRYGWLMFLVIAAGLGWAAEASESTSKAGEVHFELYRDYLIVAQGSVGPLRGLTFLVDTGATPTVLDTRVARKLGLALEPVTTTVVNGKVDAGMGWAPSVELGPVRREGVRVVVRDLSFLGEALPLRIDAMVGLDVLGREPFEIDYRLQRIRFGGESRLPVRLPLELEDGLAVVRAGVDHAAARLLVDTGAPAVVLFGRAAEAKMVTSSWRIGEVERKEVRLKSFAVGGMELRGERAWMTENQTGFHLDGLMSPAGLGMTKVAFDLGRGEVSFAR